MKKLLAWVKDQVEARQNLHALRDRRAFSVRLGITLLVAAKRWPRALPFKPKVILDVGASVGGVSEQLAILYQPSFVVMVEPQPDLAAVCGSLRLAPRQIVFNCCLGRESLERVSFNVLSRYDSSSILLPTHKLQEDFNLEFSKKSVLLLPMKTLDQVVEECQLEVVDLIKIDVQGYELEVLRGGERTLPKTKAVVLEASFSEYYEGQPLFGDIYPHLKRLGFEMYYAFDFVHTKAGTPIQCDVCFVNTARL